MKSIELHATLRPSIGLLNWQPRVESGYLSLQFGPPHAIIRDPIEPAEDASAKVQLLLLRRRVFIVGQVELWIQNSNWVMSSPRGEITGNDDSVDEHVLQFMEGQILETVAVERFERSLVGELSFDLGCKLHFEYELTHGDESELLSVWEITGDRASVRRDGTVRKESVPRNIYDLKN